MLTFERRRWQKALLLVIVAAVVGTILAGEKPKPKAKYACKFKPGEWNPQDWLPIQRPDYGYCGTWTQKEDCIENAPPKDATEKEVKTKYRHRHACMLYKKKVKGNVTVTATMLFVERMAPSVVLVSNLGADAQGRKEVHEQYEIVLFDKGINIWHLRYQDGKAVWRKVAYSRFPLEKGKKYTMEVKITKTKRKGVVLGKTLAVKVNGNHEIGYLDELLPEAFYIGITGSEGVNRFYDFSLR